MDGSTVGSLCVLFVLLSLSAYFSASETAFSSMNRILIKNLAAGGNKRAEKALHLAEQYDKLISTILIGNNIVNIVASSLATVTAARLSDSSWAVTLSTFILTVIILIFCEISPKSLAKDSAESFAMFSAPFMQLLLILLTPVNYCFMAWKRLLTKLIKPKTVQSEIEEELLTFVEEAEHEGNLDEEESDLIRNAIEFNETVAEDIYTPRVDIVAVSVEDSHEKIRQAFYKSGYSRLPVYRNSIDNIIGVLNQKDFTNPGNAARPIEEIMSKPLLIFPSIKISKLLSMLQKKKCHLAVLVDEYGGTMGIVTLEDVVEELVGEIWDEHDQVIEEFTDLGSGRYRVVCSASLEDMFEFIGAKPLSQEPEAVNVGGWVVECLGKIPREGDCFQADGLAVTVIKCDGRRVEEIMIQLTQGADDESI